MAKSDLKQSKSQNLEDGNYLWVYLTILFLTTCFSNSKVLDYTLVPRFAFLSVSFIVLTVLLVRIKSSYKITLDMTTIPLLGYCMISFVSILWAKNKPEALFESGKIFLGAATFFITLYYLRKEEKVENYLTKLISSLALFFSLIAFYQLLKLAHFELNNTYEVNALSGHKNLLSGFLFLSLPFSIYGLLQSEKVWKYISFISLITAFVLIIILQTRSVWLAMFVAGLCYIIFVLLNARLNYFKSNLKVIIYTGSFLLLVILFITFLLHSKGQLQNFTERLNIAHYAESATGNERIGLWKKTITLCDEYMPLGVGAGNWQIMYPKNGVDIIPSVAFDNHTFQRPHNDFLWVLSETGYVGILFYLLFFCSVLFYSIKIIITNKNIDSKLVVLLSSTLLGFLVFSFFDFPKERVEFIVISSIIVAILYNRITIQNSILGFKQMNVKGIYILIFTISILCINLFVAYHKLRGEYYMKRVYKYKAAQNWYAVIKYCDKASSSIYTIDPTTIPVSWYRGLANFSLNKQSEAFKDFKDAYEITPYNHHVINNLATSYEVSGNHEEAKKLYKDASGINPHFDDPKLNLAAIFYNEKNYKEALTWTQKASGKEPRKLEYLKFIESILKSQ